MARYKLTDTQKQSIGTAQMQLNQSPQLHQQAQDKLNEIMGLVFDAHGIDAASTGCEIDVKTWEIITPDKPKKAARK